MAREVYDEGMVIGYDDRATVGAWHRVIRVHGLDNGQLDWVSESVHS
jgi:hypothetical protein